MADSIARIEVEKAGLLSLIQDSGRNGYQAFGLPVGGALDRRAAETANWLVGQRKDAPVLEITLQGPVLRFEADLQIAITGADLSPTVAGEKVARYQTLNLKKGQRLEFGPRQSGCRAYLAIGGQWEIPRWLGSYSSLQIGQEFWPSGSRLEDGSCLQIGQRTPVAVRSVAPKEQPFHAHQITLRFMAGPEFSWFPDGLIRHFTTYPFTLGADSNRMGYRLREELPGYRAGRELISSGIVPGTVQILPSGAPVILLADAQTTGGYPRIANILNKDLDYLAQLVPGDKIRFSEVE